MRVLILVFVVLVATLLNVVAGENQVVEAQDMEVVSKLEKAFMSQINRATTKKVTAQTKETATVSQKAKKNHFTSTKINANDFQAAQTTFMGVATDGFLGTSVYASSDSSCNSATMMSFDRLGVCTREGGNNSFNSQSMAMHITWDKKSSDYYISSLTSHYQSKNCVWADYVEPTTVLGLDTCYNFPSAVFMNQYVLSKNILENFEPPSAGILYTRYGTAHGCRNRTPKQVYGFHYFSSSECRNDDDGKGYYKFNCNGSNQPVMELYGEDATCTNVVSTETAPEECSGRREPATYECVAPSITPMAKDAKNKKQLRGEASM